MSEHRNAQTCVRMRTNAVDTEVRRLFLFNQTKKKQEAQGNKRMNTGAHKRA
ncbi:hypothetical protein J14TS2_54320 [Bacillus sp. J14TS2]|nr:hypothetical protein J14TS2_54280 [Bacillus sp. J14TS2]GIN74957.1 hypothetical protein J14TS2_54320 [Bacillus sp. J14TS2]